MFEKVKPSRVLESITVERSFLCFSIIYLVASLFVSSNDIAFLVVFFTGIIEMLLSVMFIWKVLVISNTNTSVRAMLTGVAILTLGVFLSVGFEGFDWESLFP